MKGDRKDKVGAMKSVYVRFYDKENLGDDLFLQILADRYLNKFTVLKTFKSGHFNAADKVNIVRESRLKTIINRGVSCVLKSTYLLTMPLIRRHDLMLYIGGSLFMETNNLKLWERERRFYKNLNIPYYILGSNVGPVQTKKFISILESIFINAEDVCFRDTASYILFDSVPSVRRASDIVFTLDFKKYEVATEKKAIISIIDGFTKFEPELASTYESQILELTKNLIIDGYEVVLMSFCAYENDEYAINRIINSMDANVRDSVSVYFYRGDLESALRQIAVCEIIVASRFHAAILGLLFNKKVLPMAYSDKTLNTLKDLNFKGPVIDIRKIQNFDGKSFDFRNVVINDVSAQIKLAEKQFRELDKVLEKRASDVETK